MKKIVILTSMALSALFLVESVGAVTPGMYVGGGLGVSRLDTRDNPLFNDRGWNHVNSSVERGGLGWKAFIGYNLNDFLGLELGYGAYADSKYSGAIVNTNTRLVVSRKNALGAVSLVGKASLPLGESGFSVYALGGGAQVNSRVHYQLPSSGWNSAPSSASQNKFRPIYGGGVGYAFSEQFSGALEVSRIRGDGEKHHKLFPNADALTLNLTYHFN